MGANENIAAQVRAYDQTSTLQESQGNALFPESGINPEPFKNTPNILVREQDRAYGLAALVQTTPPWMGFSYFRRSLVPFPP